MLRSTHVKIHTCQNPHISRSKHVKIHTFRVRHLLISTPVKIHIHVKIHTCHDPHNFPQSIRPTIQDIDLIFFPFNHYPPIFSLNGYPNPSYCFLLSAPSFCIPSHPTRFPAFSSTPPNPLACESRFWDAAFIASTASCFSCAPLFFQSAEPVTLPTTSCSHKSDQHDQ